MTQDVTKGLWKGNLNLFGTNFLFDSGSIDRSETPLRWLWDDDDVRFAHHPRKTAEKRKRGNLFSPSPQPCCTTVPTKLHRHVPLPPRASKDAWAQNPHPAYDAAYWPRHPKLMSKSSQSITYYHPVKRILPMLVHPKRSQTPIIGQLGCSALP